MRMLMRSVLLATMLAGSLGLVACNSGTDHPITPQGDTGPGVDVLVGDTGTDVGVDTKPGTDIGTDTGTDTDIGTGADVLPDIPMDPDLVQFLDPANPPISDEVIVGTLAMPTGPTGFKYVSYWADPNEADWINPADGKPGFHAYALFPATEMAARSHGKSIWVFSSGTSMAYGARLLRVDQDGKNLRLLKDDTLYQGHCKEYDPEFSQDDQWVYYVRSCEVKSSDYPTIPSNLEFEFRARVNPQGTADDVQPFVATNVLEPSTPGSPAQMLFGHFSEDGTKFFARQMNSKTLTTGVVYSIDTTSMLGVKTLELAAGFDTVTPGPAYIHHFIMPGLAGSLHFVVAYSSVRNAADHTLWYMATMSGSTGKVTPAYPIPVDGSASTTTFAHSISPTSMDRFTFIGSARFQPDGRTLEMGIGLSGIDGTGVKYSDQRGIGGRWTSWNP